MDKDPDALERGPSLTRLSYSYEEASWQSRWIWVVSATVALLSSRYMLVNLNIHYPLHLLLLQLGTAATIATVVRFRTWSTGTISWEVHFKPGWSAVMLAAVMAAATLFSLQAVLHFRNLPTLTMLTVTICCVETWRTVVLDHTSRVRWKIAQATALTLACAGILATDHRLEVAGLLSAIPAVLLTGLAKALGTNSGNRTTRPTLASWDLNFLYCGIGIAMAFACIALRQDESWAGFASAFRWKYLPLLGINVSATSIAMLLEQSFLFSTSSTRREPLTLLELTGAVGLVSTLLARRSYTSVPQLLLFFCATAVVWVGESVNTGILHGWWRPYEALPYDFDDLKDYEEAATPDTVSEASYVSNQSGRRENGNLKGALAVIGLLALWIPFIGFNFSERVFQGVTITPLSLDREYTPQTPVELVISMYKEPVDEVAQLVSKLKTMPNLRDVRTHIYIKDQDNDTDIDSVKVDTGADEITRLPNVGREGQTYLYHILNHWDALATHTVFLQAEVHNPREFYPRIGDYFDPARTGMLNLGWHGQCRCDECGDRFGFSDTTHLFPHVYNRVYNQDSNTTSCDEVLLSYKGQFIASARRIRGVDIAVYRDLHDAFVNEDSWAHDEGYLQGRPDSMSAPDFGFTMERMWNLLLQCNSMSIGWKCPTLLSGSRIGGNIEDCQCFDS